ncbi:MAG: DUF3566 domain-containing protein [Propionicimonas sp.]|uniref:DUF3566 domain-containing protein n=1 Tax=Propionicimonas sp. TaxID=1955623 RepID=UPI003D0CFCAA
MTERQGTAGGATETEHSHPQWSVEGAESYGDGGLGDTVVRLPKITDDGPVPVPSTPAPAAPAPSAPAPSAKGGAAKPEEHPAAVTAPASPFAGPTSFVEPTMAAPAMAAAVAAPAAANATKPKSSLRRTRKARLRLSKIDPWSVMKTSFLFSIAFGIMFWVAVSVVWTVIVSSGLFDAINEAIVNIISSPNAQSTFRIEDYINTNKVLGITALLAVVNVVISTALGTLTAFLYNLSANILGGLELTLAED